MRAPRSLLDWLQHQLDRLPRILWFYAAISFGLAIIFMGMQPGQTLIRILPEFDFKDKLQHFSAFAFFAALLFRWIYPFDVRKRPRGLAPWLPVLLIPILIGTIDEFLQGYTPRRSSDPLDLLADSLGAATACWLGLHLRGQQLRRWKRRRRMRRPRRYRLPHHLKGS